MNADDIRGATDRVMAGQGGLHIVLMAARLYAHTMDDEANQDDPIWWCFKHGSVAPTRTQCYKQRIYHFGDGPCDIAAATQPQRIT